jgi:cytochrome P450
MGIVLMAAACFPEEQAKVQAELDEVVGKHRGSSTPHLQPYRFNGLSAKAPTFADQPSLPRLQAFISEAFRWRPVIAMGRYLHQSFVPEVYNNHLRIGPPDN